jgi:hypothetical protein
VSTIATALTPTETLARRTERWDGDNTTQWTYPCVPPANRACAHLALIVCVAVLVGRAAGTVTQTWGGRVLERCSGAHSIAWP